MSISRREFLVTSSAALVSGMTTGATSASEAGTGTGRPPGTDKTPYDFVIVEGHRDVYEYNDRFGAGETSPLRDSMLPRYVEGGMDVIIMPVSGTAPRMRGFNHDMLEGSLQMLEVIFREIEKAGDRAGIILSRNDVPSAPSRERTWFFLDMEGAEPIQVNPESGFSRDQRLAVLRHFYRLGVRGIQLTHNERNYLADGIELEGRGAGGLTRFGIEVIEEMNRLGMMVGVSHLSDTSLFHAAEVSTAPLVSTHTNVRPFVDTPRQHSAAEVRTIARTGGLVGLRYILDGRTHTPYELLADQVEYVAELVGVQHLGIGWLGHDSGDPRGGPHPGHTEVELQTFYEHWDSFIQMLSYRGLSDDEIGLVVGGNFLRIWREILA